jgi:hypothetical protein
VTFKPGKEMEQRVRELERQAAEAAAARAAGAHSMSPTLSATTTYDSGNNQG